MALAYLGLTVALRALLGAADRLTDGATWARVALAVSDLVTLPVVRRTVDGALAGVVFLAVWFRTSAALEAGASSGAVAAVSVAPQAALTQGVAAMAPCPPAAQATAEPPPPNCVVSYTVVEGDNLWDISRRFYGDGTQYVVIFRANEGRVMTTGEPFTNPRLIRPGWVLDVPLSGYNVWTAGEHVMYRVRPDDSLWRISESLLGDGFRWTEVWELNQGRVMTDGRRFTDPDLIYPGWILQLPLEARVEVAPPPAEAPPTPSTPAPPSIPSPTAPAPTPSEAERAAQEKPTSVPAQEPERDGSRGVQWPFPGPSQVLAAAAGLAATGAAVLVVRRLARRAISGRLPTDTGRKRATGDAGKVILAARAVLRGLAEFGFDDLRLVLAREAERFLEFTLDCPPGDGEALLRTRYDLGRRLACAIDGELVGSTRVRLKLSRFQRLAGLLADDGTAAEPLLLVPIGAADSGLYYLNLAAAGSVAVAGTEHETRQLLSAWLGTLAVVHGPEELALLPAGSAMTQLRELAALPHFAAGGEHLAQRSVQDLAVELEEAIVARADGTTGGLGAAILALVGLGVDYKEDIERLDTVLRRGPERRIYVVAVAEGVEEPETLWGLGAAVVFGGHGERLEGGEAGGLELEPGELALSVGREPPLILQPVEVRTEILRPFMQREALAEYEEAHPGIADPADDGDEVATEEQWEDVLPTVGEETVPGGVEEDGDEASNSMSPEPAEEAVAEPQQAEMVNRSGGAGGATRQSPLPLTEEEAPDSETADAGGPLFSVRCFGSFRVETTSGEVTGWTVQKAREMLAYLIAHGGAPVLRDQVAEALWPDCDRAQVDQLLYNAAYYLRRALKSAVRTGDIQPLVVSAQRYHLRSGLFRVDVDAFDAHLRRAESLDASEALVEYERALALYQGDFVGDEPYEWAEPYRREYQRRFVDAAHRAAKLAVESRDIAKAAEFYKGILARDPIDEEAARGLMRCYAKLGDVNGVRKVYKVLCESLRRELEDDKAEPLPETTGLFRELSEAR
ncbi:MAG: LysM peptidoglycan-binding domain-containing protein [Dehalococcoidia bacterium]|nr:LysM peptidoglycan-binding domain-containing protein [Dehalococcoidia bacterium]